MQFGPQKLKQSWRIWQLTNLNFQESTDDIEKEKQHDDDCDEDMECETILDNVAAPGDVLGLEAIVGLTPPPGKNFVYMNCLSLVPITNFQSLSLNITILKFGSW